MAHDDAQRLASFLASKEECLLRLRDVGHEQHHLIAAGNMSELFALLARKQGLLDRLKLIEEQLRPFRDQSPEARQWPSPESRAACADSLARSQRLLAEILEQEQRGESALRIRRDEAAARLQGAHVAGHTRTAYGRELPRAAQQLDLSSER